MLLLGGKNNTDELILGVGRETMVRNQRLNKAFTRAIRCIASDELALRRIPS